MEQNEKDNAPIIIPDPKVIIQTFGAKDIEVNGIWELQHLITRGYRITSMVKLDKDILVVFEK